MVLQFGQSEYLLATTITMGFEFLKPRGNWLISIKMVYTEKQSFKGMETYFTFSILYHEYEEISVGSDNGNKVDSKPKDNVFSTD